jgi:hypothetical protein
MADTHVEFQIYLKDTELSQMLYGNLVTSQVRKNNVSGKPSGLDGAKAMVGNVFGVEEKDFFEVRYVVVNLGQLKEDSRLFARRIDMIIRTIREENDSIIDIAYKILPEESAPEI